MSVRLRRLQADYDQVKTVFHEHPFIQIVGVEGNPPEKYTIEFRLPGLVPGPTDDVRAGATHRAEVFLPLDYPRRPPFCRMITPVFHPNIDPQKICIGDHWSAGQSLVQLLGQIAQMICFQSYNIQSPLNARAAEWAEKNVTQLPLFREDLTPE